MARPILHLPAPAHGKFSNRLENSYWPAASIRDALAFKTVDDALAAAECLTSPPHREEKTE
jgi:hypothetical protein